MTTLAFVPVRGGSRGIPDKNLREFCGRPLVSWILHSLQDATRVDAIVVATDSMRILETVEELALPKVAVFERSAESATDTAPTEAVVLEYLEHHALAGDDAFVLAQATSPFTRGSDVDQAIATWRRSGADSLLSVVRCRRFFWDQGGHPLNYDPGRRPRRQDMAGTLMENGALYVSSVGAVRRSGNRISGEVALFEMPEHTAAELDEEADWVVAEALMRWHRPEAAHVPSGGS